jgi:hypothetical protein
LENGELQSERFFVTFGREKRQGQERDPDEITISMEFKACEPPEAVHRLIEEYTNLISPIRMANPTPAVIENEPPPPQPATP